MSSRRLFFLLAVVLPAAMATGAGQGESAAAGQPVTLTYFTGEHPNTPLSGDLPVYQEIAKKTGVSVKLQTVPSGQETEKINVILASGVFPDMINWSIQNINQYADRVFVQLDPLIEKHGPNLQKVLTPDVKLMIYNVEGKIYGIPTVHRGEHMMGWMLRKDWLEKGKLQEPKTLDQWVSVLTAFRDGDFDGNGKIDTTPVTARGATAYLLVGPCYGMHPDAYSSFWQPDGDRVKMMLDSPAYKEMLAYLSRLATQGLLDKEFTVITTPQWEEKMINSRAGAAMDYIIRSDMCNVGGRKLNPAYTLYAPEFPTGPRGDRGMRVYSSTLPTNSVGVTTACKNTQAALRWIDYVWSEEGATLFGWGIRGVSWDLVNGKKTYINNYEKLDYTLLNKLGIRPSVFPFRWDRDVVDYIYDATYPEGNAGYRKNAAWKVYPLPQLSFTKDEQDVMKDWNSNVAPLITQYRDGIAVGTRPLSDWDELVGKVRAMGYDKYTAVINAAWARYLVLARQ